MRSSDTTYAVRHLHGGPISLVFLEAGGTDSARKDTALLYASHATSIHPDDLEVIGTIQWPHNRSTGPCGRDEASIRTFLDKSLTTTP
ncbi:hypothetical protein [Paeniglutamicibacter sp.]|uniref:hypothetical protein n=1 Tax=Paeniglutamicibacter sp. TaxID=1934391 RepID=UPI00398A0888